MLVVVPIHGTIDETALSDVLGLLALGGKSGCLSVSHNDDRGEIYLDAGRVSFAEMTGRRSRSTNVRVQVEETVYQLLGWPQGSFTFNSSQRAPEATPVLSLDPEGLLLEAARRVDEWGQIRRRIPSFDVVYRRSGSSLGLAAADLTAEQQAILPLLDGTRDVTSVVEASGLGEFDAARALYGLLTAGFATLLERRSKVRHLEYREVLAYVVREAGLDNAEWRKDAARHIADCPSCARRLRNVHVRHTSGTAAERRARDRRANDRRAAPERRTICNLAWRQANAERRAAPRREGERRTAGVGRRGEDIARTARVMTVATPAVPVPLPPLPTPTGRKTEARRIELRPAHRQPPPPPPSDPPPPPPPPPREPSRDIVWLTTPEESAALIRRDSVARPARPRPKEPPPPAPAPPATMGPVSIPAIIVLPVEAKKPAARQPKAQPRRTAHARRRAHRLKQAVYGTVIAAVGITGGYAVMEIASSLSNRMDASATSVPTRTPATATRTGETGATDTTARAVSLEPLPAAVAAVRPDSTTPAVRERARERAVVAAQTVHVPAPVQVLPPTAAPSAPAVALGPDTELEAGGWTTVTRAEAASILGGSLAAIQGLRIESISTSSVGGRARVRVAQIARTGTRIVLTQMSSGAESAPIPAGTRPTEVSVSEMSSEGSPATIGTASLAGIFVTVRSTLPAGDLRPLILRLAAAR